MTAQFNENSPGSKSQSDSKIQRTSGGIEGRESETSESRVKEQEVEKILNKRKI